ncbi:hypothetical protein [Arthrobacter russicus]|jgi:hypothetical protein|uniref:Uncharacterized protein n=1 Tax=Arthrobacter russicus TaxID=172040 RepID=A0ABU1J7B2_9MICC|nr:hypothetical protein [Arthrobacter russicus]MDR6268314.1 hypothetical protein [Arthrobacter russicus]
MATEEKRSWIIGILAALGYCGYLVLVLVQAQGQPLVDVDYVPAMLWTIAGAIALSILLDLTTSLAAAEKSRRKDSRDREIGRFGESVGQAFLVIGGVGALLLAIFELGYFWIANLLYLCFALSAVLGSIAKIVGYRRGFQKW